MGAAVKEQILIPVASPRVGELEVRYVNQALRASAISGTTGEFLQRFEAEFARYSDCRFGIATSNGTTALHLALAALGIGPGDEVLASTFTNMATFFAIVYQGARPVPIDIEEDTWNMDPSLLEVRITNRTRAILPVHIYGHPVDMDPVLEIARKHNLYVIEDAAEAHGATYKGRKVGSLSNLACFSFYANKIVTTGEGGMITTNDPALAQRVRQLRGLAYGPSGNRFMHRAVGFNYRFPNILAALGCAQLENIERVIAGKRRMASAYNRYFASVPEIQCPVEKPYAQNVYWMYHLVLRGSMSGRRREVMEGLRERGIETREAFVPYNAQQIFIDRGWTAVSDCPVAVRIGASGLYLPSSHDLRPEEIQYIARSLQEVVYQLQSA